MSPAQDRNPLERLQEKVDTSGDCWLWLGALDKDGYGKFWVQNHTVRAARWAYEQEYGDIPEGLQVDHTCENPPCVRPSHLESVTCHENLMRGATYAATTAAAAECMYGHPFDEENTYTWHGLRQCRTCQKQRKHEWDKQHGY